MNSGAALKPRARGSVRPRATCSLSIPLPDTGDGAEIPCRFGLFLALHRVARVGQRLQPRFGYRLAGILTDSIGAVIELLQRALDLREYLLDIAAHREIVVRLLDAAALVRHVVADTLALVGLRLAETNEVLVDQLELGAEP